MIDVNKVREIIFPTGGGAAGSLLSINACSIIDTIVYAAIGAIVGYAIKLLCDHIALKLKIWKRKRKQKRLKG